MSVEVADLVASLRGEDANFVALMTRAGVGVDALGRNTERSITSIRGLGLAMGVLSAGVMVSAIKKAIDFQSATQAVANNSNLSAIQLENMRQVTLALSSQTGQSTESISEGYLAIAKHAYSGAAAVNILTTATKNAAATNSSAANDAMVLANILNESMVTNQQLASSTDLATHYMDVLHVAVQNSNWTMKDFVEGGKRAFATAGAFGVPIEATAAQLAILSKTFSSTHQASLLWSGMLRSLESPTAKAAAGMKALGIATGIDLLGDVKRLQKDGAFLPQFIQDLTRATGGDFNKVRSILPQSSYASALEGLIRRQKELNDLTAHTTAARTGAGFAGFIGTNDAFKAQQATVAGQMKDFAATMNVLMIEIGTAFLPPLLKLMQAFNPIVQGFAAWAGHHQTLVAAFLAVGTAIGVLAAATFALGPALAVVFSPLGAIAAAAALLYMAWTHNFLGIQEVVRGFITFMRPVLDALSVGIQRLIKDFGAGGLAGVLRDLPRILAPLGQAFGDLWGKLLSALQSIDWGVVAMNLISGAGHLLGQLGNWIDNTGNPYVRSHMGGWILALWDWVRRVDNYLFAALGALMGRIGNWLDQQVAYIRAHAGEWARAFVEWVPRAGGDLLGMAGHQIDRLVAWMHSRAALEILNAAAVWSSHFVDWVIKAGGDLLGLAGHQIDNFVTFMRSKAGLEILNAAAVWSSHFVDWIVGAGADLLGKLGQQMDNFVAYMTGPAGQAILAAVGTWAVDLVGWVLGAGAELLARMTEAVGNLVTYLGNTAEQELHDTMGGWKDAIVGSFKDAGTWLYNAGVSILTGLLDGMKHAWSAASSWLGGLKDNIINLKGPPSVDATLLYDNGALIIKGLIDGMKSQQGALDAHLTGLTSLIGGTGTGITGAARLPTSMRGAGVFAGAGNSPVTVHVSAGAITVHGLGSAGQDTDAAHAIGQALGDFVGQMVQVQRTTSPGAKRSLPGALG